MGKQQKGIQNPMLDLLNMLNLSPEQGLCSENKPNTFRVVSVKGDITLQAKDMEDGKILIQVALPGITKDKVTFNKFDDLSLTLQAETPFGKVDGRIFLSQAIGKVSNISLENGLMQFTVEQATKSNKIDW